MNIAVEGRSALDIACSYIRDRILSGAFPAGTRLKSEHLADILGLSRMPVRDALRQLHTEGLIELRPNRGAIVTSLSPMDVQELFEIRAVLEGLAARHACQNLTDDALDKLDGVIAQMERANNDPQTWLEQHESLHEAICALSNRPRLVQQVRTGRRSLFPYVRMYIAVYHRVEVQGAEHRMLLDIARRRNPNLLEECVRDHVLSTAQAVGEFLRQRSE